MVFVYGFLLQGHPQLLSFMEHMQLPECPSNLKPHLFYLEVGLAGSTGCVAWETCHEQGNDLLQCAWFIPMAVVSPLASKPILSQRCLYGVFFQ